MIDTIPPILFITASFFYVLLVLRKRARVGYHKLSSSEYELEFPDDEDLELEPDEVALASDSESNKWFWAYDLFVIAMSVIQVAALVVLLIERHSAADEQEGLFRYTSLYANLVAWVRGFCYSSYNILDIHSLIERH